VFQKEVRKKSLAFGIMAILLASMLSALIYFGYVPTASMKTFSSYDQLNAFVVNNTPKAYYSSFEGPIDRQFRNSINPQTSDGSGRMPFPTPSAVPMPAPVTGVSLFSSGPSYSTTNIQVVGVDEADIVKTDGYYIYLLSASKNIVYIIDANPKSAEVISKIAFDNSSSLAGIYLSQDSTKLAILGSKYTIREETTYYSVGNSETKSYTREYFLPEDTQTFIKIYDISNKANPVLTRDFAATGSYFNSRMIGNYVYAVLSQPVHVVNKTVTLPSVYTGTESSPIAPSRIYYVDQEDNRYSYYTFTSIIGLNIINAVQDAANLTIMMGGASNIYVSTNNFYITYPGATTYSVWSGQSEPYTEIHRISVAENTLAFDAKEKVPGSILNQYSMDEYSGYFRIATTSWRNKMLQNNVYVLDMKLTTVGKLENLASGENIHSARFMGDKCYLVTFKKTDPLFVIDLSQPANPKVQGELKIPGYSDYMHPFDQTHLIGVGKETVEASQGDFAWYQGLKLSLFDVSNVSDPRQMGKFVIGDRGTDSAALSNPKAFLFDQSKSLLVIPVNLALINRAANEPGPSTYGTFVWQGAYIFNLTLSGGFELRGNLTHVETDIALDKESFWASSSFWVTRSLYIDNILYTISDEKVQLNRLEDLSLIAQIQLK
jgi:inhibitor of cysteine peptidase